MIEYRAKQDEGDRSCALSASSIASCQPVATRTATADGPPPKHSSWLNQIEIWLSILVRRLLSRLSCLSVQELRMRILAFIAYYNRTSNGAFHWTYKGPSARS